MIGIRLIRTLFYKIGSRNQILLVVSNCFYHLSEDYNYRGRGVVK